MKDEAFPRVRLHKLRGLINNAKEIKVPIYFADPEPSLGDENPDEERGFCWVEISKVAAKGIVEEAEEQGFEEVEGVTIEDGCLYFDGPGGEDETETEPGEPGEEEEPIDEAAET